MFAGCRSDGRVAACMSLQTTCFRVAACILRFMAENYMHEQSSASEWVGACAWVHASGCQGVDHMPTLSEHCRLVPHMAGYTDATEGHNMQVMQVFRTGKHSMCVVYPQCKTAGRCGCRWR
jgi:hypothetical protein